MLLKAKWILPVLAPSIENGAVAVEGDRITFVGPASDLPRRADLDLGDATLMPGLVNTHCHLEHSTPRGKTTPGRPFTEWVREIQNPPTPPLQKGGKGGFPFDSLLRGGTTTIADHCNPETPWFNTPFRRIVFWEVLGAQKERAAKSLEKAIERAQQDGGLVTPHSLYAMHREVLERMPASPLQSIHLLESSDEDRLLRTGTGPLADYVKERGGEVSPPKSPLSFLRPGTLLVHGNYLTPDEIGALRDRKVSVIHCPGSHRFFGHRRFPLEDLKRAGVPIALGTDSLASNEDLSMLREMRLLKESYPALDEAAILEMATLNGARALGMEKEIGSIEVGKKADLIAVKGSVLQAERVVFSMVDGRECLNR